MYPTVKLLQPEIYRICSARCQASCNQLTVTLTCDAASNEANHLYPLTRASSNSRPVTPSDLVQPIDISRLIRLFSIGPDTFMISNE